MNRVEKKTAVKVCVVCGDRANGYNFNAISCESCKAFFRRNALRKKVFKCTFNNECDINVVSRKFCQKCRLQKCLNKGMNKNLILSDEEKQIMRHKVQENKQKRYFYSKENSNDVTSTCKSQFSYYSNENTSEHSFFSEKFRFSLRNEPGMFIKPGQNQFGMPVEQDNFNDNYINREEKFDKCFLLRNFEQIFQRESEKSVNTIAGLLASTDDKPEDCGVQNVITLSANRGLNLLEQSRLNELRNAFNYPRLSSQVIPECVKHSDILRLIEANVRRLIKVMKRIECFRSLCPLDQIALMKATCPSMCILRSIQRYNFEEQGGQSRTFIKMDLFKESSTTNVYEAHKHFMQRLSQEWDSDLDVLNLLSLILLFNANRTDIIHKNLIAFEYESHKYLLKRYLEIKYSSKLESSRKFTNLMNILEELHYLNEENVRWHLEADPQNIGPLLIEIFDLKF